MSLASVFNELGQTIMPTVFAEVMPDTCTITAETTSAGTGGGRIKSGTTNAYTSIPCSYEPKQGAKFDSADKLISVNLYTLTLPTHTSGGSRIALNATTHKIVVAARGNESAKTFRIISIGDVSGVVMEVMCEKEN